MPKHQVIRDTGQSLLGVLRAELAAALFSPSLKTADEADDLADRFFSRTGLDRDPASAGHPTL